LIKNKNKSKYLLKERTKDVRGKDKKKEMTRNKIK